MRTGAAALLLCRRHAVGTANAGLPSEGPHSLLRGMGVNCFLVGEIMGGGGQVLRREGSLDCSGGWSGG